MATSKGKQEAEMAAAFTKPSTSLVKQQMGEASPLIAELQQLQDVQSLPLNRIVPSPYQMRGKVNVTRVEQLRESIDLDGLNSPIVVREVPKEKVSYYDTLLANKQIVSYYDTYYEIVAGHNRTDIFRAMERDTIPGIVRVLTDVAAARMLVADNTQHQSLSDWEKYKHLRMLQSVKAAKNVTDYANLLGLKSRTDYYGIEAFGTLPDSVHGLLDEQPDLLGHNTVYDLRELAPQYPALVDEAIRKVSVGRLKQTAILRWVKDRLAPAVEVHREEHALTDGGVHYKLVITPTEVRLTGEGFDFEAVRALIEANLPTLRKPAGGD